VVCVGPASDYVEQDRPAANRGFQAFAPHSAASVAHILCQDSGGIDDRFLGIKRNRLQGQRLRARLAENRRGLLLHTARKPPALDWGRFCAKPLGRALPKVEGVGGRRKGCGDEDECGAEKPHG
jgi:hypothetical protein